MRLIDADLLKKHYSWWGDYPEEAPERAEEKKIFDTIIDLQPTVETRRGKWVHDGPKFKQGMDWMHCSECGRKDLWMDSTKTPYCPNCGARMENDEWTE